MIQFEVATEHNSGSYSSGTAIRKHKVHADSFQSTDDWTSFYRSQDDEHEELVFKVRTSKVLYIRCEPGKP